MLTVIRKQQNPDDAFAISIFSPRHGPKKKNFEIITGAWFELTVPSLRALQQPAAQHCSVVYEALCIYAHAINFFMERAEVLKRIEAMLQEEWKKKNILSHTDF